MDLYVFRFVPGGDAANNQPCLDQISGHILTNAGILPLHRRTPPVLHRNMLMYYPPRLLSNTHRRSIEVLPQRNPSQLKESWGQINMRRNCVINMALRNTWPANEERNPDVLFKTSRLARCQSVLTNVISVVGCENNICVFQLTAAF